MQIEGSLPLELTWTLIPLGICMIFFAWGSLIFFEEARPPKGAMEVYAVGKQWMWKFEHESGQREINQLHVPVGRDVKMIMSSQDVIHSFYVPAFRIKADVLPGRYTSTWFRPTKVGTYHLFCAEYCGTDHSGMIGQVIVMEPAAYQAWLSGGGATTGTLASNGEQLFQQLGCATCHRSDTQGRGPNLIGIFGKPVLLDDGRTVMADENYIRESILNPRREDCLRLQAHHADLPGPGLGRKLDGAGGLRQVAVATAAEGIGEQSDADLRHVERAVKVLEP